MLWEEEVMGLLYALTLVLSVLAYAVTWRFRRRVRFLVAILVLIVLAVLPTVLWLVIGDPAPPGKEYTPAEVGDTR